MPAGHGVQRVVPEPTVNLPAAHDVHFVMPEDAVYVPGPQPTQALPPEAAAMAPALHESQLGEPLLAACLPAAHDVQAVAAFLSTVEVPAAQLVHWANPEAAAYRPGAQSTHAVRGMAPENLPATHALQVVDPVPAW